MRCVRALLHDRAGLACLLFLGIVLLAALLAPVADALGSAGRGRQPQAGPLRARTLAGHGQAGARHLFPPALRGPGHAGRLAAGHGATVSLGALLACWRALCAGGWSPASCGCVT